MQDLPLIRLDSSDPQERRWAQPPVRPQRVLRCDAGTRVAVLSDNGKAVRSWTDPLEALSWLEVEAAAPTNEPGRWIGFLSYDLGRLFERLPATALARRETPLFAFAFCPQSSARELVLQERTAIQKGDGRTRSNFTPEAYRAAVERVLEYIRAGDIFQANLSQRFVADCHLPAEIIYRRLLDRTAARYGGLLDFGDFALVSNSPELFLRIEPDAKSVGRRVTTRPIKGTRPRRPGMDVELRESVKDAAELNMIVDLERNDLGKVCEIGSVKVNEPRAIEAHPTVYHGVAGIEGILRSGVSFVELLRATFPGGSITGAPKIRAMEIIEELEGVRRGPYCGAIGFLASDGSMEFNVAIRTIVLRDGVAHICVGGGIVIESDPAAEYAETLTKAQAMFAALGLEAPEPAGFS